MVLMDARRSLSQRHDLVVGSLCPNFLVLIGVCSPNVLYVFSGPSDLSCSLSLDASTEFLTGSLLFFQSPAVSERDLLPGMPWNSRKQGHRVVWLPLLPCPSLLQHSFQQQQKSIGHERHLNFYPLNPSEVETITGRGIFSTPYLSIPNQVRQTAAAGGRMAEHSSAGVMIHL